MMKLKAYKNELIVGFAFLLLVMAFAYKQIQVSHQHNASSTAATSLEELKNLIALKKIWGDKKIIQKVERLKSIVPPSKVKWHRKGKKLTASFQGLNAQEFNRVMIKIMNLPVEIQKLEASNAGALYQVEFKCKW